MKKIILSLAYILLVGIVFAQEDIDRYIVKSGYIEYELSGSTKGTKKIWWDDYGNKEREEIKSSTEVKIFGMVQKEETHSINITVANKFWNVNLLDGTGVKGNNPYYDASVDYTKDMTDAEKKQFENDMLDAFGGQKLAPENFLGHKCEVMEVMGAKVWIYKGITLKSTANIMGIEANETALKFDENIKISSSKFEPPTDINFVEGSYE